jgi:hypothetical protein
MLFGGFARRCCAGSLPLASFLHKTHNLQIVPSIWYAKNEFSYSLVGRIFHCEGEQKMGKIDATVPDKIAIADLRDCSIGAHCVINMEIGEAFDCL